MTSKSTYISSAAATGAAGSYFEQHVGAYWLAMLLVKGVPPIIRDCTLTKVCFQTELLGYKTDDFLAIGTTGVGHQRRLLGQVKRNVTISAANDECKKLVLEFWSDFRNDEVFSPTSDRFVLVTLRGTNMLLDHFAGLLDCARAASDANDFDARLTAPRFLSSISVRHCGEIRQIIESVEGGHVSTSDLWRFLRVIHVLSLDLNSATRQTEALIKTLLAYSAHDQNAQEIAEASWNTLLGEASSAIPVARCYTRNELPETVRLRHSLLGQTETRGLQALSDHSALILATIRTTVGAEFHLKRDDLLQQVFENLQTAQVVLITGAAGSGKSCVAKDAVGVLAADHFVFCFRAEEFARPHLDETLHASQIPASAAMLGAVLAGQGRKVMLIESVERLLEASTRDAFSDLMSLASKDKSWRVVLTCRDYSTQLVQSCFLGAASVAYSVVSVPALSDAELREVESEFPMLSYPLAQESLRSLMRNPYVLDKALRISWSQEETLPQSEREFRTLIWREVIRVDHRSAGGLPRKREAALVQIALRRARALGMYAPCDDIDADAISALRSDALITSPQDDLNLAAPAHDVLEDWAILHWINEQFTKHSESVQELSIAIGAHPAIRRTHRKWVSELLERIPAKGDRLFQDVVRNAELPAHFRDDTIVSLLRSSSVNGLLERHSDELFANNKQLFRRLVHLLRVACVTTPTWRQPGDHYASLFNVPDGSAWESVLRVAQTRLASFTTSDFQLLLGLIEDWARGVSWQCPYPKGATSAAAIAYWLLPAVDDYRSEDVRRRTLRVIAKIPGTDRERFAALLQGDRENNRRDRAADDLEKIIFEGLDGMPTARDMPDIVIAAASRYCLYTEHDLNARAGYRHTMYLEPLFGVKQERSFGINTPSANHGPFLALLLHHPKIGLEFILSIINHSADWYAHPRVMEGHIEPPYEITLDFEDGTSKTQWCNDRLWGMYRGLTVSPYVLQSILMALERWLLDLAGEAQDRLDRILLRILRQSDSVALTAVVASVATAHPLHAGESLLVLLRSRECVQLDRRRLAAERMAPSRLAEMLPQLGGGNDVYDVERKEADALPHRRHDLELAIAHLQFGPFAPRVHDVLDRLRAAMPPVKEQSEDDRLWRLAMHRMDLRRYSVDQEATERHNAAENAGDASTSPRRVLLKPARPDRDIEEMTASSAAEFEVVNAHLGVLNWGIDVFSGGKNSASDAGRWREQLTTARSIGVSGESEFGGGPGYVAAVCVRDHWEEMTDEERDWCVDAVCGEVERAQDRWEPIARMQRDKFSADRPCAWVVSSLLNKPLIEARISRVRTAFAAALTHAMDEVRTYAAWGIGEHLWTIDRDLTLRCVNAIAYQARLAQDASDEASVNRAHVGEVSYEARVDGIESTAARLVRRALFEVDAIPDDALQTYDAHRCFGAEATRRILAILGEMPSLPVAVETFSRVAQTLVSWWDADSDQRSRTHLHSESRDFQTEFALMKLLMRFALRAEEADATKILDPIINAVDLYPREVHTFIEELISVEDSWPNTSQFWSLWKLFADSVRRAPWLGSVDREHPTGDEMLSAMFLGHWWKVGARHWRSLEGYAGHIHSLFEDLPPCSLVLDYYARFLYHVGDQSLPDAFVRIANRLQQGDARQMLRKNNTIFLLETLLQRHVYGRPLELKREATLRDAVLNLLDVLVENGSSAAFRMRDDFVTPLTS